MDHINNQKAQMRKGILELCILSILHQRKSYVAEIITELQNADLIVVEGTLYPMLTRLKSGGLLRYQWIESTHGPPRKYYEITEQGIATLDQLTKAWSQLVAQVDNIIKN